MTLKQATVLVLVCIGVTLMWTAATLVLPQESLMGLLRSRLPAILYAVRDLAMLTFFAVLLKNQG